MPAPLFTFKLHDGVSTIKFSADSKTITGASGAMSQCYQLPDFRPAKGPSARFAEPPLCMSADRKLTATAVIGGTIRVLASDETPVCEFPRPFVKSTTWRVFAPDAQTVVVLTETGEGQENFSVLRILSLADKREFAALMWQPDQKLERVAISPDNRWLALGNIAGVVAIFDWPAVLTAQRDAVDEDLLGPAGREAKRQLLESYEAHGCRLKDLYWLYAGEFPSMCCFAKFDMNTQRDFRQRGERIDAFHRGERDDLGDSYVIHESGKTPYDVMPLSYQALFRRSVIELFNAKGFRGWHAAPIALKMKGQQRLSDDYFLLRAATRLAEGPIGGLRASRYNDSRSFFDIRTWNGDDFFSFPDSWSVIVTRRVVDALLEAGISGWKAEPITTANLREKPGTILAALQKKKPAAPSKSKEVTKPYAPKVDGEAMKIAALKKLIAQHDLANVEAQIVGMAERALMLKTVSASNAVRAVGATRIGGEPDLAPGVAWPLRAGKPMLFLAQLRLSDLAPHVESGVMAAQGLVSFFVAASEKNYVWPREAGDWQVLFSPDENALTHHAYPEDLDPFAQLEACGLALKPVLSLPHTYDSGMTEENRDAYWHLRDEMTLRQSRLDHRFSGHADLLQDSGLVASAESIPGSQPGEWRLLLQIAEDSNIDLTCGDAGTVYFFVRSEDLKKGDFSRCWAIMQC